MANHKSALKRIRQNDKRRTYNRVFRARARTLVKTARQALVVAAAPAAKDITAAIEATRLAVRDLDKAAARGVIHKRNASRRKGRLMKHLAALQAAKQ
ncbi:MAG: 30S ribosomal protein S20 [Phototrophicaceae bacterium]|jgi:small subunit ribosomal protein S20